ncbi:hypothetical protein HETIRDRAFT_316296 [Heterobasidion irregulare TC 32-1]|uniref:Uncharacterized protein n=1 Tax=Heterobasidion irregulare (strain TC 32-1) TaxID=747525 RepID=W4KBF4_HETIT|nr:uncharacterized protein HETIRDRAFT_316296 [Heterobasidion irregulare TC 32-1]ETW83128.1 hypothetical protein HETIRDRAFT_316296 [Heterobasidion irregulare TC 32-1]
MSAAKYAPLPNPRAELDAEREMEDAFSSEDEDEHATSHGELTPLTIGQQDASTNPGHVFTTIRGNGIYDFERDYDCPPPGSPPGPSSTALPNSFGNSNGHIPTSPIASAFPRPSFFRRTFGSLLPSYYQRVPVNEVRSRLRGGGSENDGVFANVAAKPGSGRTVSVRAANGDIYMVPEEAQSEAPPSYASAQADSAPPYWETTVHVPSMNDLSGDMIIDDLPTGPFLTFILTTLISWFFQLPGFLLTYLLHRTHAARFGSLAGLALTFIQFGFGTSMTGVDLPGWGDGAGVPTTGEDDTPTQTVTMDMPHPTDVPMPTGDSTAMYPDMSSQSYVGREWITFILMTMGWFLLLTSLIGFFRVKRFEISVRMAAVRAQGPPPTAEDVQREMAIRRNLEDAFGLGVEIDDGTPGVPPPRGGRVQLSTAEVDMEHARRIIQEARLEHDLRAAGLL